MPDLHRTERGLDRMVNFSDAVVAIAITLLVLPLTDLVGEAQGRGAFSVLAAHSNQFWAFVITFAVTGIYWFRHHAMFELVRAYDGGLLRLNMLWLLFIVLLPFASGLVGEFGFPQGNGVVYCGTMALLSLLLGSMVLYLRSKPQLLRPDVSASDLRLRKAWAVAVFFAALAVVSIVQPALASWLLFLLFPLNWIMR